MKTTDYTAEEFSSKMMVSSRLDTGMMVSALATTYAYTVMVCSEWGSST
jgi:hypothetical protein